MLILQPSVNDPIYVFDKEDHQIMKISIMRDRRNHLKLGFEADKDITILRDKVLNKLNQEETL